MDVEEQARVAQDFLDGLLEAFGLEGNVETRTEDDIIYATVTGEQTEALVGPKASILEAINELLRTIIQRKTHRRARLRLDIGGYNERRREALKIYAGRLADQVKDEGGELMLEPMNPAERKVVHDAIAEIEGVRSFSEGEEPHRSVVIALADGYEPPATADSGTDDDDAAPADESGAAESDTDDSDTDGPAEAAAEGPAESTVEDAAEDTVEEAADQSPDDESDDGGDDSDDEPVEAGDEPIGGLRG